MSSMAVDDPPLKTRRWTRTEYERLVDQGAFREDERLELLDGLLVVREPQGSRHSAAVAALCEILARAFGAGYHVRPQLPVALDDMSEPEPDVVSFGEVHGTTSPPTHRHRCSSSRSQRSLELSIARTRAASTRALGSPTAGSSTCPMAFSRFTASRLRRRRRAPARNIELSSASHRARPSLRSARPPRASPSPACWRRRSAGANGIA